MSPAKQSKAVSRNSQEYLLRFGNSSFISFLLEPEIGFNDFFCYRGCDHASASSVFNEDGYGYLRRIRRCVGCEPGVVFEPFFGRFNFCRDNLSRSRLTRDGRDSLILRKSRYLGVRVRRRKVLFSEKTLTLRQVSEPPRLSVAWFFFICFSYLRFDYNASVCYG